MSEQLPITSQEEKTPKAAETQPSAQLAPAQTAPVKQLKKTPGEWGYDVFQFLTGKAFIIGITAVLAFAVNPKYGKDSYFGIPNYLKKFQIGFEKRLLNNSIYPMGKNPESYSVRLAAILASTMTLFHGGNLFAPFLKWLENDREKISNYFNRKFGKPGDEEIAHERLKDLPKQHWGDVVIGRIVAFITVAASFTAADALLGKDKEGKYGKGKYFFDIFEDKFGRMVAGLTKEGKAIAATPITKELTEAQKANTSYRFGKVIALDLFATSAAIIIWNAISRLSAKKRVVANKKNADTPVLHDAVASMGIPDSLVDDKLESPEIVHTQHVRPISERKPIEASTSYVNALDKQQSLEAGIAAGI